MRCASFEHEQSSDHSLLLRNKRLDACQALLTAIVGKALLQKVLAENQVKHEINGRPTPIGHLSGGCSGELLTAD